MEHHHLECENQLFLWVIFNSKLLVITRGSALHSNMWAQKETLPLQLWHDLLRLRPERQQWSLGIMKSTEIPKLCQTYIYI